MPAMEPLTLSYWQADEQAPVRDTTVGGVLGEAAAAEPDAVALVAHRPDGGRVSWTCAELLHDAQRAAAALAARFEPGERVAVWAPNIPEWVVLEFGAGLAGLVLVTVNPAYQPAELEYVLNQSGAVGIFLTPEFRSPMLEILESVRASVPALREVLLFTEWQEFLDSAPTAGSLPTVTPDDLAQIQYTSGTTGFPKGAELHHRGLTNNARLYAERVGIRSGDIYINPMPLFHTAGCGMGVLGAIQARATHVPIFAFDPGTVLDICAAEGGTLLVGVPTMHIALLAAQRTQPRNLDRLRAAGSGGSPVPADLARQVEAELGVVFTIVFGTTECSPLLTQTSPDDPADLRATTLGRPLPNTEVAVCDPTTGRPVPIGQVGELLARGYLVMRGYHSDPQATAAAIDPDGWYHTGDLASMDEQGYLRIEGRLKDMIIRGGENISPREIEDVLFAHAAVAEVAVVGVPDAQWGEIVAAVIRLNPDTVATVEELRSYCRAHLAPYKTPSRWDFVEEFPMTGSGKIQKYRLRQRLAESSAG